EFFDVLEQCPYKRRRFGNVSALALTACLPASLIITSPSLGLRRRSSHQDGWMSLGSRLDPTLHVESERDRGEKTTVGQHLKAIRPNLASRLLRLGIRFC